MLNVSTIFRLARGGVISAAVLEVLAMCLYPGGTSLNPGGTGYSLFQNSLSDLGGTVAWNGEANRGWPLHIGASILLAVAGIAGVSGLVRIYSRSTIGRWPARAAAVIVLLACAGVVGAGFAPHDRWSAVHARFSLLAVGVLPIATTLLFLATALDRSFRRRVPAGWLVLTVVVMAWGSMIFIPRPATELALILPVTLQKVAAASLVVTILLQTREADHQSSRSETSRRPRA